jgi:hypothetical protein
VLAPVSAPPVWIASSRSARTRLGSDTAFRSVKKIIDFPNGPWFWPPVRGMRYSSPRSTRERRSPR